MRIKEIEARFAAIKQEIEQRGTAMTAAEIDALEQETTQLTEERAGLIAAAEKRNGILDNIAKGAGIVSRSFQQNNSENNTPDDPFGTPEYRSGMIELHNHVGQVSADKSVAVDHFIIFDPVVFAHNIRFIKRRCEAFDVEICIKPLVLRPLWDHQRLEHLTVFPPLHYWHSVQPPFPILILPRIPCEYNTCPRLRRVTYSKYP